MCHFFLNNNKLKIRLTCTVASVRGSLGVLDGTWSWGVAQGGVPGRDGEGAGSVRMKRGQH